MGRLIQENEAGGIKYAVIEVNGKTYITQQFKGPFLEHFAKNCQRVQKKSYEVEVLLPDSPKKVKNILEGADYVANPNEGGVIIKGTVGELWVAKMEKVCKTYKKLDGSDLTPKDFVPGRPMRVKTLRGNVYNYALQVPVQRLFSVWTGWGDILVTNLPDVPHGNGDYIVCGDKDGKPDVSDIWVVNGKVFDTTYERVQQLDQNYMLKLLVDKARNPDLSVNCRIQDVSAGNVTLSSFDTALQQGKVKLIFVGSDSTRREVPLEVSERKSKDGTEVIYSINNLPMIIKKVEDRYKTVRGLACGICSAYIKTNPIHKLNVLPYRVCVVKQGKVVHSVRIAPFM